MANAPWYSKKQLRTIAETLLWQFDKERLEITKPIDVYEVIEKCLGVPYDWKYLTPDQSILGLTAFGDGYIWAWEKPFYVEGDMPYKVPLSKGTIVIDSTLTESDNRGRENFTVMHEVFHQILHKSYFEHNTVDYAHTTSSRTIRGIGGRRELLTDMDWIEWQANTCAAAFLMPQNLVKEKVVEYQDGEPTVSRRDCLIGGLVPQLAEEFGVSQEAMRIRLSEIQLIKSG